MAKCEELWAVNMHLIQTVNEFTEDIIGLKRKEKDYKQEIKKLKEELEDLRVKYYTTCSDLKEIKEKKSILKKLTGFFSQNSQTSTL